jgi:chitodextrinase
MTCSVTDGTTCTLWLAQWWINVAPGTDSAWKNMGACDGSSGPVVVPTSTDSAPSATQTSDAELIVQMNALLKSYSDAAASQSSTVPKEGKWLTELKSSISTSDYNSLKDLGYYVRLLPLNLIDQIAPNASTNPENVKRVESFISQTVWNQFFPMTNESTKELNPEGINIYTYTNFLKAVGAFPAFCSDYKNHPKLTNVDADAVCKKLLATIFAHMNKETSANSPGWKTDINYQGLYFVREYGCRNGMTNFCKTNYQMGSSFYSDTLQNGNAYFGRGAFQLSHPVNYATLSVLIFGTPDVLLQYPDMVSTTWLALGSAIYFACTSTSSKPAMIEVVDGNYKPNASDLAKNFIPGFGLTTYIINGGYECIGTTSSPTDTTIPFWKKRANYFKNFAKVIGVTEQFTEASFNCESMKSYFDTGSASSRPNYFDPMPCTLVRWESSFVAYGGMSMLKTCQAHK